jgi:hypothetical protein
MKKLFLYLLATASTYAAFGQDQELLQRFSDPTRFVNHLDLQPGIFMGKHGPEFWQLELDAHLATEHWQFSLGLNSNNQSYNPSNASSISNINMQVAYGLNLENPIFERLLFELAYQLPLHQRTLSDVLEHNDGLRLGISSRVSLGSKLLYVPGIHFYFGNSPYRYLKPYLFDSVTYYGEEISAFQSIGYGVDQGLVNRLGRRNYLNAKLSWQYRQLTDFGALADENQFDLSPFREHNLYELALSHHWVLGRVNLGIDLRLQNSDLPWNYYYINGRWRYYTGLQLKYAIE